MRDLEADGIRQQVKDAILFVRQMILKQIDDDIAKAELAMEILVAKRDVYLSLIKYMEIPSDSNFANLMFELTVYQSAASVPGRERLARELEALSRGLLKEGELK